MILESNRLLAEWFIERWERTPPVTVQVCNWDVAADQPHGQLAIFPTHIYQNFTRHDLALKPIRPRPAGWDNGCVLMEIGW